MAIEAKYENGVFKPLGRVKIKEGTVVEIHRLNKLKELASALLHEAELLDLENLATEVSATAGNPPTKGTDFFEEVRAFEKRLITRALEVSKGDEVGAARMLGLNVTTLRHKIESYGDIEETQRAYRPLRDLGFAGMWANRADIKDGVSYVNTLRDSPRD